MTEMIIAFEKARQECVRDTMYEPIEFIIHPHARLHLQREAERFLALVPYGKGESHTETLLGVPLVERVIDPPAALRTRAGDLRIVKLP